MQQNVFLRNELTTLIMVIRFTPNTSDQKVEKEKAVWRGHKLF